jgi:phosphoribosylanthranilate isomerase
MKKIITQIYEVQTPDEAEELIGIGVEHIGSVLVSQANWKIRSIKETIKNIDGTSAKSSLIPLFSNLDTIQRVIDYYDPDIVHFCEDLVWHKKAYGTCSHLINIQKKLKERFSEINIMRSIPISQPGMTDDVTTIELARLFESVSDFFLTDTVLTKEHGSSFEKQPVEGFVGITGKTCDWRVAGELVKQTRIPVILAGGLGPDNVFDGIRQVRPAGVDSCTRTNAVDPEGRWVRFKKDLKKVKQFVEETRRAERAMERR